MIAVLNIIYKISAAIIITTNLSLTEGIKIVINIFIFAFSHDTPHLNKLK